MKKVVFALIVGHCLAVAAWAEHGYSSCGNVDPQAFGRQTQAVIDKDGIVTLSRSDVYNVCEYIAQKESRTRAITVDGVRKEIVYTVDVPIVHCKPVASTFQSRVAIDKIQAYDMSAKRVAKERLAKALEKETTVLLASREVPAYYLAVYKPDTVLLVIKPQDLYGAPVAGYAPSPSEGDAPPPPAGDVPAPAPINAPAPAVAQAPGPIVAPMAEVAPRPEKILGMAPRVAMAQSKDGSVGLRSYLKDVMTQTVMGEVRQDGVTKKVPFEVQTEAISDTEVKYPQAALRLQRADGKPVDHNELPKLLATYRNVLVSTDGKDIDPAYLKIVRPDALIIIAPIPGPSIPEGFVPPAPVPVPVPMAPPGSST